MDRREHAKGRNLKAHPTVRGADGISELWRAIRFDWALHRTVGMLWIILLFGLGAPQASAQVNIEKLRGDGPERGYSGHLELNVSARTGNVETLELGAGGRLNYVGEETRTFLLGSGEVGWEGGERYSNQGLVHLRHLYRRGLRLQPEAFAQTDYDRSRSLTFRGLVGGGLRVVLQRHRVVRIWWGSAYMFEHEKLDLAPGDTHPRRTSVHRWSNYLSSAVSMGEDTAFTWTVYVQPRFDVPRDLRVLGEAHLGVGLGRTVVLATTVRMRYDSRPPAEAEGLDVALTSGVAITF